MAAPNGRLDAEGAACEKLHLEPNKPIHSPASGGLFKSSRLVLHPPLSTSPGLRKAMAIKDNVDLPEPGLVEYSSSCFRNFSPSRPWTFLLRMTSEASPDA